MNAVEIEEAVSELVAQPFNRAEFAYQFLAAFGNKDTTLKKLRSGGSNLSDIRDGVLQRNNIHLATCDPGQADETLSLLRDSPKTASTKAKFILATDGETIQAEEVQSDSPPMICTWADLPNHFGYFLPLAGITTVKQIKESSFDIRATGRLNKLYIELLKDNPEWAAPERRPDMNHFMARLIFCFFAEDTDIFRSTGLFTSTVEQFSERDSSNTHEIIANIFRAMNTKPADRASAGIPPHADAFPYVNGGLFSGSTEVPKLSKIARSYLINIGSLDWKRINPDIFGSMIQAVADDDERGALGMHYTSVPNILKVLNPLFLDDLRTQLEEAGGNTRKLLNLRNRMARIRVFDPACGSGNFLVIAYKEMRAIEAEINLRRNEIGRESAIPLTNFRGIELRDFPAEIARLALIIAEYQCDVLYRGQRLALAEFLPLDAQNWITCGNALRLDWLSICPPTGTGVKMQADDLFGTPQEQAEIDFENEGGETYICGNPPYIGSKRQTTEQKDDLSRIFEGKTSLWKSLDYVAGWFMSAAVYSTFTRAKSAFVSTNSICQGQQVAILWPLIFSCGSEIEFAYTSFKWANLASYNAGVTVVIVCISNFIGKERKIFTVADGDEFEAKVAKNINPYLVAAENILIESVSEPISAVPEMHRGNSPTDGGFLLLLRRELPSLCLNAEQTARYIKPYFGADEAIYGLSRLCIWINDDEVEEAIKIDSLLQRIQAVRNFRLSSPKEATRKAANWSHRFDERKSLPDSRTLIVPIRSSEHRPYLPVSFLERGAVVANTAFTMQNAPLWVFATIVSKIHLVWIATVCARLELRLSYTNTVGWNTFPLPRLTDQNKLDLTKCAQDILLAREAHFPASIAELYDPNEMPENLQRAHERNDEVLERIYIGRRFKNDTERLEKLFDLYTKMTASDAGRMDKAGKKAVRG
jgi:hypothetical protein